MNRGRNYRKLNGGLSLYPFRSTVSALIAKSGVVPNFKGVMDGETHVIAGNYIGPGTKLDLRLARGDKGTTNSDAGAKQHDIDYADIQKQLRAKTITKKQAGELVRIADNKLQTNIKQGLKTDKSLLNRLHASAGDTGMKIKKIAEDIGVLDKTKFIGEGKKSDPAYKLKKLAKKSKTINIGGSAPIDMDMTALKDYLNSLPKDLLEQMNALQKSGGYFMTPEDRQKLRNDKYIKPITIKDMKEHLFEKLHPK